MDQSYTSGPSPCRSNILFVVVTSFKIWMVIFLTILFVLELFSWAIPLMFVGTIGIFIALSKFKVPPPPPEAVCSFFGADIRPIGSSTDSFVTLRSRLQHHQGPSDHQHGQALTVIGHRGAGLDVPENSISAFRHCRSRGCTTVEFDVAMTKDNVAVVFHDDNLMRMTGIDREISDMTWEELRQVDISVLHPLNEKFRGEKVPTFEETVTTCLQIGLKFIIDLKYNSDERTIEVILDTFKRYPAMYDSAVISSFSPKLVYLIRRQDPKIIGCFAWRPCFHRYRTWNGCWDNLELRSNSFLLNWRDMIWDFFDEVALNHFYWWFLGLSAYFVHKDSIAKECSYRWMNKGVRLFLCIVNSPLEKLHIVQNVHLGYMTDTLDGGDLIGSSSTIHVTKLRSENSSMDNATTN